MVAPVAPGSVGRRCPACPLSRRESSCLSIPCPRSSGGPGFLSRDRGSGEAGRSQSDRAFRNARLSSFADGVARSRPRHVKSFLPPYRRAARRQELQSTTWQISFSTFSSTSASVPRTLAPAASLCPPPPISTAYSRALYSPAMLRRTRRPPLLEWRGYDRSGLHCPPASPLVSRP